jgi:outer membrane protein
LITKVVFPVLALSLAAVAAGQTAAPPAGGAGAPAAKSSAPPAAIPTKIGIINIQQAILGTVDGKKAAGDLQTKFNPRKTALERRQTEIQAMEDQLRKGSATMSDEAKVRMQRDIESNQKSLQRDAQDLNDDVDQENGKIMNELGSKMMQVIEQYATQNGYAVVLDVSNQQSPVLWASASTEITGDIVRLYDQAHPAGAASVPAPPAARPAAPAKPPASPAVKKQ